MVSDRRAELSDAPWLSEVERASAKVKVHGTAFRDRRNATDPDVRLPVSWLLRVRSIDVWLAGLALFGVAALVVLAVTIAAPEWLADASPASR
jgi:hypothetical protein